MQNGHKIFPMAATETKCSNNLPRIFLLQDPLKFTQIGIFGLKTNHLAALLLTQKAAVWSVTDRH
jgi:hypothetical protein